MCNSSICTGGRFDNAKAEAFTYKMINILNGGGLSLMISVGHRTGLFDALGQLADATSEELAKRAGLNERYVREWLGAMVSGEIVTYDSTTKRYCLPAEHAAFLTREASPDNLAVTAQFIGVMGGVEDQVVDCFHHGGGVPYTEFTRFHEVMMEESAQTTVAGLFDAILPLVDGLSGELTQGIEVADIGCGRGRALIEMAAHFPKSRFVGYDLSNEAIAFARDEAARLELHNVRFEQCDVTELDESDAFDLVTAFDAIHDQGRPDLVLANIRKALKADGVFLMQDIAASSKVENNVDHPIGALLYTISCMHCMTVSLAQGGMGLGAVWGKELALEMLGEAGFGSVTVSSLDHDIQNCYYVALPDTEVSSDDRDTETNRKVA